jgi:hypothetical protein
VLGGSCSVIDVAPALAGGETTLEVVKAALLGKTGAVTGAGSVEVPELYEGAPLPHAASSSEAKITAPLEQ